MKLFKNRGDVYISKSKFKSSREQRILLLLLTIIVIFTIVFVILMANKYGSVKNFFAEGEITTTQIEQDVTVDLPEIEGKSNYLVLETDDEQTKIHFAMLIQADSDSLAYKVTTLSPKTIVDSQSLYDIYSEGGGALLQAKLTEYFGFEIDYYVQFIQTDFIDFIDALDTFIYPSAEEVKYSSKKGDDAYTIHINEGEQNIDGNDFSALMRYYSNDKVNLSKCNEIVLYALTQLFNEDNYQNCEKLFRRLINDSSTNITVRDFENGKDNLQVFCYKNVDITIYSAPAEYEKNILTQQSLKSIKGYFSE